MPDENGSVTDENRNGTDNLVERARQLRGDGPDWKPGPDDCARCGEPLAWHYHKTSLPDSALAACLWCGGCLWWFTRKKWRVSSPFFVPPRNRRDTRYCSNACRQRAYRKRKPKA